MSAYIHSDMFAMPILGRVLVVAFGLCALACASGGPSAEQRAADLNERKRAASAKIDALEFAAALEILEPLASEADADPQLFVMMGLAHEGLGDVDAAIASYEDAIRAAYADSDAHLKLGTLLMRNGQTGRALTEFELAVKFSDRDALARFNYGLALREMGQEEVALQQLQLARDLDPLNAQYSEAVGIALAGRDDLAAVAAFEDASTLGAGDAAFHNNYGLALQRVGRDTDAEAQFRVAVEQDSASESYRFHLAALLNRRRNFEDAEMLWTALIEDFGPQWSYRVYRGRAFLELGRFADVVADGFASEAMARIGEDDTSAEALEISALAYRGLGNRTEALRFMREAVALASDNPVYLNNYGVILVENGMIPEAKKQWRRALEIDPDNETAQQNLSTFGP